MTGPTAPPNWYPDPFRRYELRYWDGARWSHHVSTAGRQGVDQPVGGPPAAGTTANQSTTANKKVQRQVRRAGVDVDGQAGGGSLLTEPVLVVNQKAKLIEVNAEYAVFNQHGQQIGAVREVGQSMLKNAVLPTGSMRTRRLQIVDGPGQVILTLTVPASFARSAVVVRRVDGVEVGRIVQKTLGIIGKIRFELRTGDRLIGSINAEDRSLWDFSIQDVAGDEIGRITRGGVGLTLKSSKKHDKYVVQIHRPLEDPLRPLVVAAALAVDTALRQK